MPDELYCAWQIWNELKVFSWLMWHSLWFRVTASDNFCPSWGHCCRFVHSNQVNKNVWGHGYAPRFDIWVELLHWLFVAWAVFSYFEGPLWHCGVRLSANKKVSIKWHIITQRAPVEAIKCLLKLTVFISILSFLESFNRIDIFGFLSSEFRILQGWNGTKVWVSTLNTMTFKFDYTPFYWTGWV